MKESYLIMSQQTVQKLMKRKRNRVMPEHEAVMYRELCEMIAKEAQCRRLWLERQRIQLQRDIDDDEAATRDGEKSS